jgi:hypothetical protein
MIHSGKREIEVKHQDHSKTEGAKSVWARPSVQRLEAGAAESQRATIADGSGQQAS